MTLLTIVQALARNVGVAVPESVVTSPRREMIEALQMANDAGEELARRVDWGVLNQAVTLIAPGLIVPPPPGVGLDLGPSFSRMAQGIAVRFGTAIVRPLARAEWNGLTPVEGVPRYFLLDGTVMEFWPALAPGESVSVSFQSKEWTSSGASFMADDDTSKIDEALLTKALIVRWRRQKGMDYADYEAEYEAALQEFAQFDDNRLRA
jgi:hypothetical protein